MQQTFPLHPGFPPTINLGPTYEAMGACKWFISVWEPSSSSLRLSQGGGSGPVREAEQACGMLSEQAACPGFAQQRSQKPLFAVGTVDALKRVHGLGCGAQAGHRGDHKERRSSGMSLTDLGCPRVCWISRALLAGAEASQATVRDFAIFFFFRLTAGDGKLCEGCGSTVSHDCHGGWVVRGHGSQRITDGSKFLKISCCSSSSYLNTLECINLSKRKYKYIFLHKPLSGIFFFKDI